MTRGNDTRGRRIEVRVSGGLGNQLFQYAFGRAKSLREGLPLVLVHTGHKEAVARPFELGNFSVVAAVRREGPLDAFLKILDRAMPAARNRYVSEPSSSFSAAINGMAGGQIYTGNWQSERYFADQATHIRRELTLNASLSGTAKEILSRISGEDSVSIHVRRGDYASDPRVAAKHGALGMDYYGKAVAAMGAKVGYPKYFVFSDDIAWTKAHLSIPDATYVCGKDGRNLPAHEELMLMAACRHNIIANSTFSWWGAWLNVNPEKTVIAPKAWYSSGIDSSDLVPASWTRI
jgi:hypothetical protein